jgi:hypothetical protein
VETDSEAFLTTEKNTRETWATISTTINNLKVTDKDKNDKPPQASEWGTSEKRVGRIVERRNGAIEFDQLGQPRIRMGETYPLNVYQINSEVIKPISVQRDLPPFYLPQVLSHLVPRLVGLNEQRGYLFAMWLPVEREIIFRYIDVEGEKLFTLHDREMRGLVIKDRVGLEGEPTYHYFSLDGKYLGSFSTGTGTTMLVSDQKTLTRLWPDAPIVRPKVLDQNPPQPERASGR